MKPENDKPLRGLFIYQFFSHYRQAALDEFLYKSKNHYEFMADTHSLGSGIQLAEQIPPERFKRARGIRVWKLYFQPRPIFASLSPRYDVLIILGNPYMITMWLSAIGGRLTGKRVLLWTHGWIRKETGIKRLVRNAFYKLANGLLLYGHRAKVIGISEGFDSDRLHVVYNALDCEAQDRTRTKIKPGDRDRTREALFADRSAHPVIVNITRLHHYKKLDMLIKAAAILKERSTEVNLLIIGDGPHKAELEALATQMGVNAVFTGALYEEIEIGRMLDASDLAVMPGPVGLLAMHALAYGVPVISNDDFDKQMPEFEAIIPGITGDFFKHDDVNSLADSIAKMLEKPISHEQRCAKSREIIERFYNPKAQRVIVDRAAEGRPANDLFNGAMPRYNAPLP